MRVPNYTLGLSQGTSRHLRIETSGTVRGLASCAARREPQATDQGAVSLA